jgi:hypothetical protein
MKISTMLTLELHETPAGKVARKCCELLRPVRDHEGRMRFRETARIIYELDNLGRHMLLVQFADGATTFLFPDEVVIQDR